MPTHTVRMEPPEHGSFISCFLRLIQNAVASFASIFNALHGGEYSCWELSMMTRHLEFLVSVLGKALVVWKLFLF